MLESKCPYFGTCGGCTAHHIPYTDQLAYKKKILQREIQFENVEVYSGNPYYYRNRMDFVFHPSGLGLREKGTWSQVVDIEHCIIADQKINSLLQELRAFFSSVDAFHLKKHSGTFRFAVLRCTRLWSSISFTLNAQSTAINAALEKIRKFAAQSSVDHVLVAYVSSETDMSISDDYIIVKGSDILEETLMGKAFYFPVQGFFQNNSSMAESMHEYCRSVLEKYKNDKGFLLDLYGGVGTFGVHNADLFKEVMIVESVKSAIDCAEKNIAKNSVQNAKSSVLDAQYLKRMSLPSPVYVITDPPRSGMHPKTIERLKELQPELILYISCNVHQLGKDILKFKEYEIRSAALFDLFPHTPHCEAVVELVKK